MRFPIRTQLLSAFALDLLLMILLGTVASQQMAVMNASASLVATHTIPSLDSVAALKGQLSAYRVTQLEYMLYTSTSDKDRSRELMGEIEAQVAQILADYKPLINSDSEDARYAEVERAWQALATANHERFLPDASQNNTGTVRPFYSRMNPLYRACEDAIAGLADESQIQAAESLAVVQSAYNTARGFIMFDTLLTLAISAGIALFLAGRIVVRIGRLTSAAGKVAAGDLDREVHIQSRDELGQLAWAFNQMIAGLRAQRHALEERNAALQESLGRQEQLTADLVRRQAAEEQAYRAQAAAEAASQAKSMFLATMSHELRTPLTAILGYAQLLRLSGSAELAEIDPLGRILVAGQHLMSLINNVLDFSKIEQGKIDLAIGDMEVCTVVHEAVDVVRPLAQRQANELQLACPDDIGSIITDPGKVRQILINLLSNAAKFTEQGRISLRVWREEGPDGAVVFAVSDTGIGIAPEHMGRLFQPFSQVDASATRRYEGTGLGLALSRQLCQALGGEISVASEPGRGTTFTVWLPSVIYTSQPDHLHAIVAARPPRHIAPTEKVA